MRMPARLSHFRTRIHGYLGRRPHRSFRLTRRRDVPKKIILPGYISFGAEVLSTLWQHKRTFVPFTLLYMLLATLLVGIVQQDQYASFVDALKGFGPDIVGGDIDGVTQTIALFGAAVTGGLSAPMDQAQQINMALLGIFSWLVVVWLLRQLLAGNTVSLRDGLYNAGAPFLSTLLIALLIAVQVLPAALAVIVYATAGSTGLLEGGVESMAFGLGTALLVVLSLYWISSSILAGIIVTLPGTYPMAAIRTAGDLAFGRRTSLLFRLLWLGLLLLFLWAVVLIPVLLLDNTLSIDWLPLVPITVQLLGAISVVVGASYIYLLYRRMIDGNS